MGCWPGTDLRVCLKCRLQILCTKSLQEYPWPQESLSDFLQLWMLLLTCSSEQSNTYNCLWMQWECMQLHVTDLKQNPQMCILTTKCLLQSNINTNVRNASQSCFSKKIPAWMWHYSHLYRISCPTLTWLWWLMNEEERTGRTFQDWERPWEKGICLSLKAQRVNRRDI